MSSVFIVVVTGPPGAGKTTLGRRLSEANASLAELSLASAVQARGSPAVVRSVRRATSKAEP
jgi:adenylate kinase family enzyme